ncbi:MAG: BamA/TamA family outer membrane protein [Planctomycetaceae bacterium]|jgi:outer membrane protein insertion porin family|nr:BamA/TamA family outer membrane protein [Planctomycetaceae bacterium]
MRNTITILTVSIAVAINCVLSAVCAAEEKHAGFASTTKTQFIDKSTGYAVDAPQNSTADPNAVLDVRITGNVQVGAKDIIKIIKTRQGRPFSEAALEEDKRALMQKGWFIDVKPKVEKTPTGYIVTFQFIERPLLHYIKVVGNHAHTKKVILEEANLKPGDALDPIAIQQAKERIEAFYKESGYYRVYVEVKIGDQIGDRGAVFEISEGPKQRILDVEFEGNQIASSARLKTLIKSKPGWFFWINSEFTRPLLDDDVETLTTYYRKLGFFYAKIDREFVECEGYTNLGQNRCWVKVKFVIDEGPRCRVRNIRFDGNHLFDEKKLLETMKLPKEKYFNQDMLEADMNRIKDKYGDDGYVFTVTEPDPRIDEDYVDLVINVKEGPRCYLRTMHIEIVGNEGGDPYTKWHPILNRSSLKPGDILRTSEINASRRRLMASQLFNANPTQGSIPEFIFEYPEEAVKDEEEQSINSVSGRDSSSPPKNSEPQIRGQARTVRKPVSFGTTPKEEEKLGKFSEFFRIKTPPQAAGANGTPANAAVIRGQVFTPPRTEQPVETNLLLAQVPPGSTSAAGSMSYGSLAALPPQVSSTGPYGTTYYQTQLKEPPATSAVYPEPIFRANPYASLAENSTVRIDPNAKPGVSNKIYPADGKWVVQETRTGQLMMSVAVSSDSGLMGRFIIQEDNFDILNFPKGFRFSDWKNAFRGKGQRFRIEAVPGTEVQRYSTSWETPYLFDLDYSFGVSGFYYERYYDEWYENRAGGNISFGKLWTPDFSTRLILGGQEVYMHRPMLPVADLYEVLGHHPMYTIGLEASHNTRDSEYMPTEGHLLTFNIEQVLGDYHFVRGGVDFRKYFMLRERPDRSGRWVLGLRTGLNVSEKNTPIYERYFGGGFTSLRGFEFRGVSPRDANGSILGGCMEFYNSAELVFPITADDMVRGSFFIDTGTVERTFTKWEDDYRVALGFGLRLTIPMMGPAPIALDFAFPVCRTRGDEKQVFSFNVGFMR